MASFTVVINFVRVFKTLSTRKTKWEKNYGQRMMGRWWVVFIYQNTSAQKSLIPLHGQQWCMRNNFWNSYPWTFFSHSSLQKRINSGQPRDCVKKDSFASFQTFPWSETFHPASRYIYFYANCMKLIVVSPFSLSASFAGKYFITCYHLNIILMCNEICFHFSNANCVTGWTWILTHCTIDTYLHCFNVNKKYFLVKSIKKNCFKVSL